MGKKIVVFGEIRESGLRNVSFEAIAAAKKVADGGEVVGLLLGERASSLATEMFHYGVDRVVTVEHEQLQLYTPDAYSQAILQVIDAEKPDGLILGHTALGKDLAPRLAAKLRAGLISDVVSLEVVDEMVLFTRPIYAGKAFEKFAVREGHILVTIRPNNITPLEKDVSRSGAVSSMEVDIKSLRMFIKEVVRKTAGGIDLSEAKIIVSGGRGVKSKDGFNQLQELANLLGGAVGASRGACDADYCDYSLQIGQTGKVVTPDLYIACGISGAIQHVAGMSNSKVIVAINKDPEAPIFGIADYGIVGDLFEVLPLLIEEFKSVAVS
ncbi:electron transfer flavoprotein subunit alpha/FixB family protein [Neobacillus sp. OS1-33]|jgi:electron transfer flavoprotein alpha subunit|uniref:electron transfer flavoprotein subunit alpha/FixB family protein n=1 Tax=Neobacillus sp. OS1-33 TaxID=3070683 RepID=UPI0027DFC0F2|nr:electron transfer flavoprotein subunit alpha/FixB family protein [Neobacillus sp. OS1-33]WML24642.1 electron transfer flavoprotein subunit alpha/FixB family protein [Neobacillus sp. OS1-33]